MSMRLSATIAGVLAVILIVAGCGGGGDDAGGNDGGGSGETTTTAAPLSKAEFIEKADALCRQNGKRVQSELAAYSKENKIKSGLTPKQVDDVANDIVIPAFNRQLDGISALGIPERDQIQIVAFLTEIKTAIKKAENNPVLVVQPTSKLFLKADEVVEGYGFKVCGQREGSA